MISKVKEFLGNYRPKNVTGGAAVYPLMVLFLLNTVDELDSQAFNILGPNIRDHFGLNLAGILGLISIVGIADLLLGLPVGYFADRWNRTRMAGAGAATWGAFTLLTGFAPTIGILALARAGSGLGKTVNSPTHNSLLSDYYPVSVRPNVYGFHRIANSIGQSIGPIAAGLLAAA
ncbi:MAG: MFS transporter, partial [Acidimicrobiia bacterium]